ncbi:MAG TPA: PilZ domain-containing protein [Terriglobales bacterium]|nr:PilZ domain-containing protein [Terriglobales bacterium]
MGLQSLLVTRDQQVIQVLRPTLEQLSIAVEVCRGARSGNEILLSEKFDGVIVDCDDLQGGLELLEGLKKGTSNRNSVSFAVLHGTSTQRAFELGANFVMQKPVSPLNAMRCFSAAVGFMTRERRRYFRHAVDMTVKLVLAEGKELQAAATNLSEGGMAIHYPGKLDKTSFASVVFTLPGRTASVECKAQLAWADGSGRAGIRFGQMSAVSREQLDRWLSEQMDKVERLAF